MWKAEQPEKDLVSEIAHCCLIKKSTLYTKQEIIQKFTMSLDTMEVIHTILFAKTEICLEVVDIRQFQRL